VIPASKAVDPSTVLTGGEAGYFEQAAERAQLVGQYDRWGIEQPAWYDVAFLVIVFLAITVGGVVAAIWAGRKIF